jgi:hypothetical protein
VAWILGIQECELSITLHQLKIKIAKLTQTKPTPFKNGIPRKVETLLVLVQVLTSKAKYLTC